MTLDMRAKHNSFTPAACFSCQLPYDSAIRPSIDALQRLYERLFEIADRISFVGELEAEGGKG